MAESGGDMSERPDRPRFIPPQRGFAEYLRDKTRQAVLRLRFWLSEEAAFGTRFLLLPFFLSIGIITYFELPYEADWSEIAAFCLLAAGLGFLARRRCFPLAVFAFMLCIGIGALLAKAETMRLSTAMLRQSGFTHIKARIVGLERQENGAYRVLAELLSAARPALRPQPQRLRLSARQLPAGAVLGGGLEGLVFLRSFSGPVRPGSYDFAFQNYFQAVGGQGDFVGLPRRFAAPPPRAIGRAALKIAAFRAFVSERIRAAVGGEKGAVAAALITGERAGIAPATNQALRAAGLAHILSISGLHMAMVAGMVLLVCRLLLGLFPVFSSRRPAKKIAAVFALFAAAFYVLLSGADVSAERSFIMVAVMLLAVLCGRTAISLRNLAISACVIMACRPHEIMGPSFQMSFAATAALISAFGAWSVWRRRKREGAAEDAAARGLPAPARQAVPKMRAHFKAWIIVPLVSTCLSSLVAGAAGGLYSAYHFNNTAPFGVLSNALALPIMSVLVMPFALLGMALMPLHLEAWPLSVMGIGILGVENVAYWVAGFSPAGNLGVITPAALGFLTAGMVLLMFLRTPLRFFACILLAIGGGIYALTPLPLALIAENGRLTASFAQGRALSLNTSRPALFTVKIWQTGFAARAILPPMQAGAFGQAAAAAGGRFVCAGDLCRARLANGKILAAAESAAAQAEATRTGDVTVLNFMTDDRQENALHEAAARSGKILITQRDLALFGAAEIRPASLFFAWRGGGAMKILSAVPAPNRPWNSYRRFSKRARGMPA